MDPNYSAQDVAWCDVCKTAIAQSYCDFCHVNLCKPCIGCLLYTSDAADDMQCVDLGGRRIIKKTR